MRKQDIEVGETYLFVATDNPTRKHLEGQPFKVVERKAVFRKLKRGTRKPIRFFNENGVGARAEELGPLPANEWYTCPDCKEASKIEDLHTRLIDDQTRKACPNCGTVADVIIHLSMDFNMELMPELGTDPVPITYKKPDIEDPGVLAQPGADEPEWPCVECDDGEMVQDGGVSPQGTTRYKCKSCGHTVTFP